MYKINKVEEVEEIESMESFDKCPYYAPMVWKWEVTDYTINGLEFKTQTLIGSGRVVIKAMTLKNWLKREGLDEEVTTETITKAIEYAKIQAIKRKVNGKPVPSTHAFLCKNKSKDSIAYKCYEMIKEKKQLLTSYTKLTSELVGKTGVAESEYLRSYLFCHTSSSVRYAPNDNYDDDNDKIVKENIAYRLLEVYYDLISERYVNDAQEIAEYMEHLCGMGVEACDMSSTLQAVIKQHKLWNSLSFNEITELLRVLDEEELEDITISDVKEK